MHRSQLLDRSYFLDEGEDSLDDSHDSPPNQPPVSPLAKSKQASLLQKMNQEKVKKRFQRMIDVQTSPSLMSQSVLLTTESSLDSQLSRECHHPSLRVDPPSDSDKLNKSSILNNMCQSQMQNIIQKTNQKKKLKLNAKAMEFNNLRAVQESEESHNSEQDLNVWNTPATPYPSHTLYYKSKEQLDYSFCQPPSSNTYFSLNNPLSNTSTSFFDNYNSSGSNRLDSGRSNKQHHSNLSCILGTHQNNYLYPPQSQAPQRKLKNLFKCQIGQQGSKQGNAPLYTNHTHHKHLNSSRNRKSNHIENEDVRYKIYLDKIDEDSRTTLMIANIPNKYTMEDLMQKIDSKGHKDKYDYFYIPVDLEFESNKGYAFINLEHPSYIKKFYKDFHNKKWKEFNSDKICQLKYGSIQGIYDIIQHFMTASIMKDPKYKPYIKYDGINGQKNQQLVSNANQLWNQNINSSQQ